MTAVNVIHQPDRIIVLTDGLGTAEGGRVGEYGKVAIVPHIPCVITVRGVGGVAHTLGGMLAGSGYDTFAKLKAVLPGYARKYVPMLSKPVKHKIDHEIRLIGYSRDNNRFESYFMVDGDAYAHRGKKPWILYPDDAPMLAAPQPSAEAIDAAGFICPEVSDFDPATHGVRLMDAQRRTYPNKIGAFVQVTTVMKDGVESRIVHRWPNKIGEEVAA